MSKFKLHRSVTLPARVQPWMCYTTAGELRAAMYRYGQYSDRFQGWSITWDDADKQYILRAGDMRLTYTRKAEAYKFARENPVKAAA